MNERPTPETDALREAIDNGAAVEAEMTSFAMKLERERDEAREERDIARLEFEEISNERYEEIQKVLKERDEARNKMADALQEVDLRTLDFERMKQERDTALEQLESTKSRLKGERAAAREAIDVAEAERDKAYERFYKNPDAAEYEREKAERQEAKWQDKWTWQSRAFARHLKKIEELEAELSTLKSKNE